MTRLLIPTRLNETIPAGEYQVMYVLPAAGVVQIAPSAISIGQKDKPEWGSLQRHPGVEIECAHCRAWFGVDQIPIDEVSGWRCGSCRVG